MTDSFLLGFLRNISISSHQARISELKRRQFFGSNQMQIRQEWNFLQSIDTSQQIMVELRIYIFFGGMQRRNWIKLYFMMRYPLLSRLLDVPVCRLPSNTIFNHVRNSLKKTTITNGQLPDDSLIIVRKNINWTIWDTNSRSLLQSTFFLQLFNLNKEFEESLELNSSICQSLKHLNSIKLPVLSFYLYELQSNDHENKLQLMGNSSFESKVTAYHNWVESLDSSIQYCTIHKEYKTTGHCTIDKKQVVWNKEMYDRRIASSKYIARVFSYRIEADNYCCSQMVFHVETEFYTKLENMKTKDSQTLYLLLSMLYGYSELFKIAKKYFYIELDMIGVTPMGEVRVWINQNFSSNEFIYLQDHPLAEQRLVERILQVIVSKPNQFSLPLSFSKFHRDHLQAPTFLQSIIKIKKFARMKNIRIHSCLETVKLSSQTLNKSNTYQEKLNSFPFGLPSRLVIKPLDRDTNADLETSDSKCVTLKKERDRALSIDSMIHYTGKMTESSYAIVNQVNLGADEVKIYEPLQDQLEMNTFKSLFEYNSTH